MLGCQTVRRCVRPNRWLAVSKAFDSASSRVVPVARAISAPGETLSALQ